MNRAARHPQTDAHDVKHSPQAPTYFYADLPLLVLTFLMHPQGECLGVRLFGAGPLKCGLDRRRVEGDFGKSCLWNGFKFIELFRLRRNLGR